VFAILAVLVPIWLRIRTHHLVSSEHIETVAHGSGSHP